MSLPTALSTYASPLSVVQDPPESYVIKDGVKVIERFFTVPLNYSKPDGPKIRVHARNTVPLKFASTPEQESKLPYIVFLQGGPGSEVTLSYAKIVMNELHNRGYQVLWLDQRGTGLSTPICGDLLDHLSDNEKADYFKHFRSDNIVRDCEHIRHILLGQKENPEDRKWTLLGQSYGGWCSFTYLSFYPEGLKEVFLTGGMAGLMPHPDHDYEKLVLKVVERNGVYYEKYPQDVKRVRNVLKYLDSNKVSTPNGGNLTVNRFLQLGIKFGMRAGIDEVHELVLRATNDLELFGRFSYKLAQLIEHESGFDGNPLYAIMQENIYCSGKASNWSAARAASKEDRFSWEKMKSKPETEPVYFQGEMMSPSMLDDYPGLRPFKKATEILAQYDGWEPWFDEKQLSRNEVKITAATYVEDMYVDFGLAMETARKIPRVKQFITNQMYHDALRKNTKEVLGKLFELSKREED